VLCYLRRRCLPFRLDVSNADTRYLRARIRREIAPPLLALRPSARDSIMNAMELLSAESDLVEKLAQRELAAISRKGRIDVAGLLRTPLALQRRILRQALKRAMGREPGFRKVESVLRLCEREPGAARVRLSKDLVAVRERDHLRLASGEIEPEVIALILPLGRTQLPGRGLVVEVKTRALERGKSSLPVPSPDAFVAATAAVKMPICMRSPRPDDRIAPLGMGGHTKAVSKILKDRKMTAAERAGARLVADQDGVLWVMGGPVAERARVREDTGEILVVRVESATSPAGPD
jgi:tRNA(Ile)-lysidine synthase